ncbi:helix-turn-helix domain-containing protein [Geodermatophilus sabuli]|uniref:DNA binding domain-containing protein, excisionase family n=1 Tax=Geodermatophilus sabuli TaxID=1564158 RepID=A0A285EGA5_9ACTN|nr:helix-turn-helix domain-containing protein [Geodermatophilus sabuli]MBB3084716.1 excisionase family DNA binding protein [Geodermatophilus sabuli]SNX97096.1 DNA binding domain-containing protein, excisionase family [Geodermatophilus sabuli]
MSDPQRLRDVLAKDPLLLTPEEAAEILRVGRTTIYALMKSGGLRPVHIGRSCRLARAELERYVACLQSAPPPPPAERDGRPGAGATTDHDGRLELVHSPPDIP